MTIQSFLPYDNYTLLTRLSPNEVKKRLNDNIGDKPGFGFSSSLQNNKPYAGVLVNNQYQIQRVINYRNSFLPLIKIMINEGITGTEVVFEMKPAIFVLIFMFIWLSLVGLTSVIAFALMLFKPEKVFGSSFNPGMLTPVAMLFMGYALLMAGYKFESNNSKRFFAELLEKVPED